MEQPIIRHRNEMRVNARRVHHLGDDVLDRGGANETQVHLELILQPPRSASHASQKQENAYLQDLQRLVDTVDAVRRERVQERPANAHYQPTSQSARCVVLRITRHDA